jgi:hypothetical protein
MTRQAYQHEAAVRGKGPEPADSEEASKPLATIRRSDSEELRLEWSSYMGHPYLSLRLWGKDRSGRWWPDPKRGVSIRLGELEEARDALNEAIRLADDYYRARDSRRQLRTDQPRSQSARPRSALPGRTPQEPPSWAAALPRTESAAQGSLPFNEFE